MERLPDLEFLAVVMERLEAFAPGVTEGAELKGSSLISPSGWVIGVAPPRHGGGRHYDLVVFPDVNTRPGAGMQTDVPCFLDCVVSISADVRHAVDSWVQTAGACLLELRDGRARFAERDGPEDVRGVPGWRAITSGVVGMGLDDAENRRIQGALLDANVLHRLADSFTDALESPYFNGVKIFYGGRPGAMQAEVRVNGERHEAASAALAALGLPEPTVFTTVRCFALLLPLVATATATAPAAASEVEEAEVVGEDAASSGGGLALAEPCCAGCDCGGHLDPEHPGFDLPFPHLMLELSEEERAQRLRADTGVIMIAEGVGNFLKVRLPIRLDDGRTVVYLCWVYLEAKVIDELTERFRRDDVEGHTFEGLFCNAIEPWGEQLLRAPVVLGGQRLKENSRVARPEVLSTSHALLGRVLGETWPAGQVLGDRDPRLSVKGH